MKHPARIGYAKPTPIGFRATEAAEYLGISESGVWRLLREGRLPRVKVAGCTVIPRAACEALLRAEA